MGEAPETLVPLPLRRAIRTKHVKAHHNTDSARTWVNDWCDAEAKSGCDTKETLDLYAGPCHCHCMGTKKTMETMMHKTMPFTNEARAREYAANMVREFGDTISSVKKTSRGWVVNYYRKG